MTHRPISDCHLPWEWLLIDPLGKVQPCCWATRCVGDLNEQTIEEVWNGPDMVRLRRSIRDGYVDRVCRHAGCKFVRDMDRTFGVEAYDLRCPWNEEVSLRDSDRPDHCVSGWSAPESWGVWSEGATATLLLDLPERPLADFRIEILCRGAGCEETPPTFVGVQVNGNDMDRWEFRFPDSVDHSQWRTIDVPHELMTTNRIELRFFIEAPVSPKLWGRDDSRLIGIGLSALRVATVD
jgi:hypothetical protein